VALSGCGLIVMGFAAFCLSTIFSEAFDNFDLYFWMIGLGVLALLVGVVELALRLDKRKRRTISAFSLLGPLAICVIVGLVEPNVHGVFPIFFLASIPIWLIGAIILLASL